MSAPLDLGVEVDALDEEEGLLLDVQVDLEVVDDGEQEVVVDSELTLDVLDVLQIPVLADGLHEFEDQDDLVRELADDLVLLGPLLLRLVQQGHVQSQVPRVVQQERDHGVQFEILLYALVVFFQEPDVDVFLVEFEAAVDTPPVLLDPLSVEVLVDLDGQAVGVVVHLGQQFQHEEVQFLVVALHTVYQEVGD